MVRNDGREAGRGTLATRVRAQVGPRKGEAIGRASEMKKGELKIKGESASGYKGLRVSPESIYLDEG